MGAKSSIESLLTPTTPLTPLTPLTAQTSKSSQAPQTPLTPFTPNTPLMVFSPKSPHLTVLSMQNVNQFMPTFTINDYDNSLNASRPVYEPTIYIRAKDRCEFDDVPEMRKLLSSSYWRNHSHWLQELQNLYIKNMRFLYNLMFPVSRLSAGTVSHLQKTLNASKISHEHSANVKLCIEYLSVYDKFISQVKLSIKDGALCDHLKLGELLKDEHRLRTMPAKSTQFLADHIEHISEAFDSFDIIQEKRFLISLLRSQNEHSEAIRDKFLAAIKKPSEYENIPKMAQELLEAVTGASGQRILRELERFNAKLDTFLAIEDHLPNLLENCINKGNCRMDLNILKKKFTSVKWPFKQK